MSKCVNCKHWDKNTDQHYPENFDFGKCKNVVMFWDATEWEMPKCERRVLTKDAKGKKAFVQDGSDYRAEFITLKDFGCNDFVDANSTGEGTGEVKELLQELEPFTQGCFSGQVSDWPQLKPLLRRVYGALKALEENAIIR